MALFRPGVRKVQQHLIEASGLELASQHLDRIAADDADVGETLSFAEQQQMADARPMHLEAEEVLVGPRCGECSERFAIAEADLECAPRAPTEQPVEIERRAGGV